MSTTLRVVLFAFAALLLLLTVHLVRRNKLQLKYALIWMLLGALMVVASVFPQLASLATGLLGMGLTSNFIFMAAILVLLFMNLSLCIIVSWQARHIRTLVQHVALLEKDVDALAKGGGAKG